MAEQVSFPIVVGLIALFFGAMLLLYRFANKMIMAKILELKRKNEDLSQVIERLYQTRLNDNRDLRSRLERLEDKLDALGMPRGSEREVALEKVFAKAK